MGLSEYDKTHVGEILNGEGSWFTARLLRALNDLLPFADASNELRIRQAFPEECGVLTAWWNTPSGGDAE